MHSRRVADTLGVCEIVSGRAMAALDLEHSIGEDNQLVRRAGAVPHRHPVAHPRSPRAASAAPTRPISGRATTLCLHTRMPGPSALTVARVGRFVSFIADARLADQRAHKGTQE